jgi:excisionase family DNA binding protein
LEKRFLTLKETAGYLNVSVHLLYRLVETKQIPHTRIGRKILFDIKKLEGFIEENSFEIQDWSKRAMELK